MTAKRKKRAFAAAALIAAVSYAFIIQALERHSLKKPCSGEILKLV